MPGDYVSLVLETAQKRLATDRLGTLCTGDDWSPAHSSNVLIEPITKTAILLPAPRSATWQSNGTGVNARFNKANYTLTSSKWRNEGIDFYDDVYLVGTDPSGNPGEAVVTTSNIGRNCGVYLKWFAANSSSQEWIQLECGYGANPSAPETHPIALRVWSSGKVEVWRFNSYLGDIDISGNENPQQLANTFTDLLIIPYRRRELLLLSNRGGGGTMLFTDLDDIDDPTINAEMPFWWFVPSGLAKVQCAPLRFAESGYVCGIPSYFRQAPKVGATETNLLAVDDNGQDSDAFLVELDDINEPFVPDGTENAARIRVDLEGDSYRTPNLYAAHCAFEGELAETPAAEVALDDWLVKLSLDVSDSPSDSSITAELKNPEEITTAGVHGLLTISNRPYELRIVPADEEAEPVLIFTGRTEPVQFQDANSDTAKRVTLECRDHFKQLENYIFSDVVPLDGMNLIDAVRFILNTAGFENAQLDLEALDFVLPETANPSRGEWNCEIQTGDTAAEWIQRLHQDYMATWFYGWVPQADGFKFVLKSPEGLSDAAVCKLYCSLAEAIDDLGGEEGETEEELRARITSLLYRSYSEEILEPEANDIWVTGWNPHTQRPIQVHKQDAASIEPTTDVDERPDNWLGEIRKFGLFDSTLTTQAACERAANIIFERLTPHRVMAEFESDFLIKADGTPVWRGDVVTLGDKGDYRIKSVSAQFVTEPKTGDIKWRPTRYAAEKILTESQSTNQLAGKSLAEIINAHRLRAVTRSVIHKRSEHLTTARAGQIFVL